MGVCSSCRQTRREPGCGTESNFRRANVARAWRSLPVFDRCQHQHQHGQPDGMTVLRSMRLAIELIGQHGEVVMPFMQTSEFPNPPGFGLGLADSISSDRVESDFAARWLRRRIEERLELVVDVLESEIMSEQGAVYLGELPEDFRVGEQAVAHLDEGADDIDTHGDGLVGIQNAGGHEGTVFGENAGEFSATSVARF